MKIKTIAFFALLSLMAMATLHAQNVVITDDSTHNAHGSSMLDVYSLSKGFLMPRLTTTQRTGIAYPATGLIVFDTDSSNFFFYNGSAWVNLLTLANIAAISDTIWKEDVANKYVRLNNSINRVGVGVNNPDGKMEVWGDSIHNATDTIPLFAVKDKDGNDVFVVYPRGVMVYVDTITDTSGYKDNVTTSVTGFRVGKKTGAGSKGFDDEYFTISPAGNVDTLGSQARILWYPLKEAFLSGRVIVESPDSVGYNSWASGYLSKSIGDYSQALGYRPKAVGDYSTAIGNYALALGDNSFALGDSTIAGGGGGNKAANNNCYAFGKNTQAIGNGSYAFGKNALSTGTGSFAFGDSASAQNEESFAFGRGALAEGYRSFAFGSAGIDSLGQATGVARAIGDYSFAIGQGSVSVGFGAIALGLGDSARGDYSFAAGYRTIASGYCATSFGRDTKARGLYSFASGKSCVADNEYSIAMGYESNATGRFTTAIGYGSTANNDWATAIGYLSEATGRGSFAACGGQAWGDVSIAIGPESTASGFGSLTLGFMTEAIGNYSTSIGYLNNADSSYSVAIGRFNYARGKFSHAYGNSNVAYSAYETVVGKSCTSYTPNNKIGWDPNDRLFVIGNGNTTASNAITVLKNGNTGIGISNPSARLDILGNTFMRYNSGNSVLQMSMSGGNSLYFMPKDHQVEINSDHTGSPNIMTWTKYGDIGIGTTSPSSKLEVNGTIKASDFTSAGGQNIIVGDDTYLSDIDIANTLGIYGNQNTDRGGIRFGSGGGTIFGLDGCIGIGTIDPGTYRLNVVGGSGITAGRFKGEVAYTYLGYTSGSTDYGVYAYSYSSTSTYNTGVRGSAGGTGTINTGIYGIASGATTNYGVYCSGNGGYTGSWSNLSDIKFKKNVRPMEGMLEKLMLLKPKTFEMRTEEYGFMGLNEGTQYGLIAQELKEVFPELVSLGHHPGEVSDEDQRVIHEPLEYQQVDYIPLTAILIRAIQEQQQQINELKAEIMALNNKQNKPAQISGENSEIQKLSLQIEELNKKYDALIQQNSASAEK